MLAKNQRNRNKTDNKTRFDNKNINLYHLCKTPSMDMSSSSNSIRQISTNKSLKSQRLSDLEMQATHHWYRFNTKKSKKQTQKWVGFASGTYWPKGDKIAKSIKPLPSFWREPFAKIMISKSEFYIQVGNDFNEWKCYNWFETIFDWTNWISTQWKYYWQCENRWFR